MLTPSTPPSVFSGECVDDVADICESIEEKDLTVEERIISHTIRDPKTLRKMINTGDSSSPTSEHDDYSSDNENLSPI